MIKIAAVVVALQTRAGSAIHGLWTFPAMVSASFLIAWGVEVGQFVFSRGLALAILACLQTLPLFALQGSLAWTAGKDPEATRLVFAYFVGAIRPLIGFGWQLVYIVLVLSHLFRRDGKLAEIRLDDEHSVEVVSLVPILSYSCWIWYKGSFSLMDTAVLIMLYLGYLYILSRVPPKSSVSSPTVGAVPQYILNFGHRIRWMAIVSFFSLGGLLLFFTTSVFVDSALAAGALLGLSGYAFLQFVGPLIAEFPEKVTSFYWARRPETASLALMNLVATTISHWTLLAASIPIIFSISVGQVAAIPMDGVQRDELLLTIMPQILGVMILARLYLRFWEAATLFVLWLVQLLMPDLSVAISWIYGIWLIVLLVDSTTRSSQLRTLRLFWRLVQNPRLPPAQAKAPEMAVEG